jgi:hypothetical protein
MSTYYNYVIIILFVRNQLDQVGKKFSQNIQKLDLVLK